ncbi:MAG: glycosyltransferase family 2 protein [Lachnospiraceae bacterium]|nr:glycosyltransferase family 2 protein [Lachnospiraceae bacterium]
MDKLQVLMSSYNGRKYIKEQLDSIMAQDCQESGIADLFLLVRDDGSTDGTQKILEQYSKKYPDRIRWFQGSNKGVIQSFFALMANAGKADYYALADQDDYWMPSKMSAGIKKLKQMEEHSNSVKITGTGSIPLLYCCRPLLADELLNPVSIHVDNPEMKPGFGNALIENIVTGCTTVFNDTLRRMVSGHIPEYATMHDRWMYLTATCFGEIYYDETPYIYYRQHGGNAVGKNTGRLPELKYRINKFKKDNQSSSRQALEFLQIFKTELENRQDLQEKEKLLKLFIKGKKNSKARKKLISSGSIYRQRSLDNKIFKILVRINLY